MSRPRPKTCGQRGASQRRAPVNNHGLARGVAHPALHAPYGGRRAPQQLCCLPLRQAHVSHPSVKILVVHALNFSV